MVMLCFLYKKNKKYSTSGKLEDGTKLEWMFYYDYLNYFYYKNTV